MFSSSLWSLLVNLYLWYRVCVRVKSLAASHSSATLSLNSRTASMSLLYTPCLGDVWGKGILLPNRMSWSKSSPSILWSPCIVSGRPNGRIQLPINASMKSLVPMHVSMVRLPRLCVAGVCCWGCQYRCRSMRPVECSNFP